MITGHGTLGRGTKDLSKHEQVLTT
jgi:hypothetical protein